MLADEGLVKPATSQAYPVWWLITIYRNIGTKAHGLLACWLAGLLACWLAVVFIISSLL